MAGVNLRDYQKEAVYKMKNGCILCGDVGSGKSRTALAYYYICQGGTLDTESYVYMKEPKDLYIISTAKKRDSLEWEHELVPFLLSSIDNFTYKNKVIIDSWNNIKKYADTKDSFFIFDEQRVVGYGAWTKAFLKIAKFNNWILLSATPGDKWTDYIPVFMANGFYRTKTEFETEHVVYDYRMNFPKIQRYLGTKKLERLRDQILVSMDFHRNIPLNHEYIITSYDKMAYRELGRGKMMNGFFVRWNPYKDQPIKNASEYCQCVRRLVNSDPSRQLALLELIENHPKTIIFYNYNYELDILKSSLMSQKGLILAEWNGHKHDPIPDSDSWAYLVQYTSGCEGWNCIETDTMIFYSENYSYRMMEQAAGRIARMNTPFKELYYYHFRTNSQIDIAIARALREKKTFNESKFANKRL